MLARPPAAAFHALRQRKYYKRHTQHRACCSVEYGIDELNLLVKLKFLAAAQTHDRKQVGSAVSRLIKALAKKL
jgi:hypothetical protein